MEGIRTKNPENKNGGMEETGARNTTAFKLDANIVAINIPTD